MLCPTAIGSFGPIATEAPALLDTHTSKPSWAASDLVGCCEKRERDIEKASLM